MVSYKQEVICPHCGNKNKEFMDVSSEKNKLKIEPDNPYSWLDEGYVFDCQSCGELYEIKKLKINITFELNKTK